MCKELEEITLKQLLTEDKYKNLSLDELDEVIGNDLNYDDYGKLEGDWSIDKAKILLEQWK